MVWQVDGRKIVVGGLSGFPAERFLSQIKRCEEVSCDASSKFLFRNARQFLQNSFLLFGSGACYLRERHGEGADLIAAHIHSPVKSVTGYVFKSCGE